MKKQNLLIPGVVFGMILFVAISATGNSMVCSKHDLGCLNQRGFGGSEVGPMQGTAYIDYGEICIYCHTPHNADTTAPLWNRQLPTHSSYKLYASPNFDSKNDGPDGISLACLSCHDGTVAVDAVLNQPRSREIVDSGVHYQMKPGTGGTGGTACGKCHSRGTGAYGGMSGAHDATLKYLEPDLTNDHPISVSLPSYNIDQGFNQPTIPSKDGGRAFPNGVKTFSGDKVQCASCHNPHDPDERNAEGRDPFLRASNKYSSLCLTCHQK